METLIPLIVIVVKIIALTFMLTLPLIAYSVYAERRFAAVIQDRVGPNRTGFFGLLQPLADGLKFILKEDFTPSHVNKFFFWLAPALTMVPALVTLSVIPFGSDFFGETLVIADVSVGPLLVFAIASLSVYGITFAGWASNNKYSFFGGVRSCAQMISYEIALGLSIIPVLMVFGELNLSNIVQQQSESGWLILPLWNEAGHVFCSAFWEHPETQQRLWIWIPMMISFVIFTISIFAETNRMPFDLPECETELVGGYHTEYSSMKFALFFLGEYAAMIVGSALIVTLFLGGWSLPFGWDSWVFDSFGNWAGIIHLGVFLTKLVAFILFFILIRWTIPRFRYDQLMKLGWVVFFEAALINVLIAAVMMAFPHLKTQTERIALIGGVVIFSGLMFYIAKSLDKMLRNDSKEANLTVNDSIQP